MRFSLTSHRSPHVPIGHSAPRSLQTEIEQKLTHVSRMKYEPRLLGDDDHRLKFLNGENSSGEKCSYIYRMKAVDALSKLDEQLKKIECRRVRPQCGNLKEYILSLRDPPQAPLKGASVNLCRAFAAAYESAHYGLKPFGETEYNNFMTLLHELLSCIRHKGMKSKKSSQSSSSQHKQHTSASQRSRSAGSQKARSPTKPISKGEPRLIDQSAASTSQTEWHAENIPQRGITVGHVTKRNQSRAVTRSEETVELLERKRTSRGSDVGSDTERGSRITRTSNSSSSRSDEMQPLMASRLVRQESVSEDVL
ncbi:protein C1orf43-like isoform X2 [Patiria miniata]|nr:protein C1orf43-like isoform X2 [Patiria miniata]XP_038071885.1 protein C1orf43-like isoform X2 [Patiria miniata]